MMLSVLYLLVPSAFKLGSRNLFYSSSIIVRKRFALSAGLLVSQADRVSNCSIQNEAIVVDYFLYTVWWKIDYYITSIIVVKISPRVDWRLRAWRQFPWHSWSWLINIEQISENIKRLNHFARSTLTETGLSGEASYKHKTSKEKTFPVHTYRSAATLTWLNLYVFCWAGVFWISLRAFMCLRLDTSLRISKAKAAWSKPRGTHFQ